MGKMNFLELEGKDHLEKFAYAKIIVVKDSICV